jgi:hypothetical protein
MTAFPNTSRNTGLVHDKDGDDRLDLVTCGFVHDEVTDDVTCDEADHDLWNDQLSEEDCDDDRDDVVVRRAVAVETTTIKAAAGTMRNQHQ